MSNDSYITVKDAANSLGVDTAKIYYLLKQGIIEGFKVPIQDMWEPSWRVSLDSLRSYITKKNTKSVTKSFDINDDRHIQAAIVILKSAGYKLSKPVVTYEEV